MNDNFDPLKELSQALLQEYGIQCENWIGEGGSSVVYRGRLRKGTPCAVRISKLHLSKEQLATELDSLRQFKLAPEHPFAVRLLSDELQPPMPFRGRLVTLWELCEGGDLAKVLEQYQNGMSANEAIRYLQNIASAIDHYNEFGIYHRDVKLANILVSHGQVKLADFGLAKLYDESTAFHTAPGTPSFAPLEQLEGREVDRSVDVFGLAACYVALRSLSPPFGTGTKQEIINRQRAGTILIGSLSADEVMILEAALSSNPELRPKSASELMTRLHIASDAINSNKRFSPFSLEEAARHAELREQDNLRRKQQAEEETRLATQKALEEHLQRLRLAAADHINRDEWLQAYDYVDQILQLTPQDEEARTQKEFLSTRCVPDTIFGSICTILAAEMQSIEERTRITFIGYIGGLSCILSLLSFSFKVFQGGKYGGPDGIFYCFLFVFYYVTIIEFFDAFIRNACNDTPKNSDGCLKKGWQFVLCLVFVPISDHLHKSLPHELMNSGIYHYICAFLFFISTPVWIITIRKSDEFTCHLTRSQSRKFRQRVISAIPSLQIPLLRQQICERLLQKQHGLAKYYEDVL